MDFKEAFLIMKMGGRVKRPNWDGYWMWDKEKKTIMMHCRSDQSDNGNPVLDIRETNRVEFTLNNILANDFALATVENCPVLRAELDKANTKPTMDFNDALIALKSGKKVSRKSWDEKAYTCISLAGCKVSEMIFEQYWLNSTDILATDWYIVE